MPSLLVFACRRNHSWGLSGHQTSLLNMPDVVKSSRIILILNQKTSQPSHILATWARRAVARGNPKPQRVALNTGDANFTLIFLFAHRSLNDFDLHEVIYKGRASQVCVASVKSSGREVALKMYRKKKLTSLERSVLLVSLTHVMLNAYNLSHSWMTC